MKDRNCQYYGEEEIFVINDNFNCAEQTKMMRKSFKFARGKTKERTI